MKRFRFLLITAMFLLAGFIQASAQNGDTAKFRFEAKKVPVGTVLHYLKTNVDGTKPEYVSQFVAAADRLEAFKFHPKAAPAGLVIAEMDWTNFSVKKLDSYRYFADGERKFFAGLTFDRDKKQVEVSIPMLKPEAEIVAIERLPFHVYNFDFASLNLAFAHLKNPKQNFTIGIADPVLNDSGKLFEYKGEVVISYAGDEKRNGAACRKYEIDGAGLQDRGGAIWVNKKKGWIEDMEIDLPDNPEWTSFKFKLLKTEKMSREEWENFMKTQIN